MPFRVYRFTEFEVFRSSTVPFTALEHFLATTKGQRYKLVLALRCRFEFLSCAVMSSYTDDTAVTEFIEENAEQTGDRECD